MSLCDRQTDRRTSCESIVHAMHTHRAVKKHAHTVTLSHQLSMSFDITSGNASSKITSTTFRSKVLQFSTKYNKELQIKMKLVKPYMYK